MSEAVSGSALTRSGRALLIALQLLTRIPIYLRFQPTDADMGRSALCYPLVGLVIGTALLLLWLLSTALWDGLYSLQAAVLLAGWCLLSGGLHIDGLADSADAWVGGFGDRQRTLELLKDPTCGPMAVMLVVLVLALKLVALTGLLAAVAEAGLSPWHLLWAPVLGRAATLALLVFTPYVRPEGMGATLHRALPKRPAEALLLALAVAVLLFCQQGVWVLALVLLTFFALRYLMLQRLGGITGDTTGALVELTEVAVLLALLIN